MSIMMDGVHRGWLHLPPSPKSFAASNLSRSLKDENAIHLLCRGVELNMVQSFRHTSSSKFASQTHSAVNTNWIKNGAMKGHQEELKKDGLDTYERIKRAENRLAHLDSQIGKQNSKLLASSSHVTVNGAGYNRIRTSRGRYYPFTTRRHVDGSHGDPRHCGDFSF